MTAHCFPSESCTASTRQHGHNHVPFRCPSPRRQAIPLLFPEPGFLLDYDALIFNLVVIALHASAFVFARPFTASVSFASSSALQYGSNRARS